MGWYYDYGEKEEQQENNKRCKEEKPQENNNQYVRRVTDQVDAIGNFLQGERMVVGDVVFVVSLAFLAATIYMLLTK